MPTYVIQEQPENRETRLYLSEFGKFETSVQLDDDKVHPMIQPEVTAEIIIELLRRNPEAAEKVRVFLGGK